MGGHLDCTRTSTKKLGREAVRIWVRAITDMKVKDQWWFGLRAYNRDDPPPQVTY